MGRPTWEHRRKRPSRRDLRLPRALRGPAPPTFACRYYRSARGVKVEIQIVRISLLAQDAVEQNFAPQNNFALLAEHSLSSVLDRYVETFEEAYAADASVRYLDFLPSPDDGHFVAIAAELIRVDMEYSWAHDAGKTVADYQQDLPQVLGNREVLAGVAFEEYRQRLRHGEALTPDDFQRRYGVSTDNWQRIDTAEGQTISTHGSQREKGAKTADVREALALASDVVDFPQPGDSFVGFTICRELGRGAFARVYEAQQQTLANRPVVLKVAAGESAEPEHLARLQHTNIVPIYSVHPHSRFSVACMPLLGDRTLADLLTAIRAESTAGTPAQNLISTFLERREDTVVGDGDATATPTSDDAQQRASVVVPAVADGSYVNAVVWIIQQLAQGLAHAHQRGIVHRDLKPANILLTDEGVPLVLDFNLSEDVVVHGPASLIVGGTLPYMSPEQLAAVSNGGGLSAASDIFSLGVLFYELLTGQRPFADRQGPLEAVLPAAIADRQDCALDLRQSNPTIPPSIESAVRKCLATDPDARYGSMDNLAADLQRHLEHQPLRYARNPSLVERTAKWVRRRPRTSSAAGVAAVAAMVLIVVGLMLSTRSQRLADAQALQQFDEFSQHTPGLFMAVGIPHSETEVLRDAVVRVEGALGSYGVLDDPEWRARANYANLTAPKRQALNDRFSELLFLLSNAHLELAERAPEDDAHIEAARRANARGLDLFDRKQAPQALLRQQRELAVEGERSPEALPPAVDDLAGHHNSALDRYDRVAEMQANGDFQGAYALLDELRDRNPADAATWLLTGNALVSNGKLDEAHGCFTTAIKLAQDLYLGYLYRGLCSLERGRFEAAADDFTKVIATKPQLACGYLNRAIAYRELRRDRESIEDLTDALARRDDQLRALLLRAQLKQRLGDTAGAAQDRDSAMTLTPTDELDWIARGIAKLPDSPESALTDFQRALQLNPASISALRNCIHVLADQLHRENEAMVMIDRLLQILPSDPAALAGKAVLLARQGKREAAVTGVQTLLQTSTEPRFLFQAACALSLTSSQHTTDSAKALTLLLRAITADPGLAFRAQTDPDLANLRATDEFKALLGEVRDLGRLRLEFAKRASASNTREDESQ